MNQCQDVNQVGKLGRAMVASAPDKCSLRLAVRTLASHAGNRGSIPLGSASLVIKKENSIAYVLTDQRSSFFSNSATSALDCK